MFHTETDRPPSAFHPKKKYIHQPPNESTGAAGRHLTPISLFDKLPTVP
jgi:hypothetical protein